jgi:peptidoglycan/LPS O-acetylase OafA/YrhL
LFNGHGAVVLFFVLSGFVLRLSLANKRTMPPATVSIDFVSARLFRLFPVIVATSLVIAAVNWFCHGRPISIRELLLNATLFETTINGAFWTLQVEVFGSLLILVAFLVERTSSWWSVVVMATIILPTSFAGHSQPFIIRYLYPFLFGYIVAVKPQTVARFAPYGWTILLGALAGFYCAAALGFVLKQWLLLLTVISATLIVAVLSTKRYRRALAWRPLRTLGTLSYSFYALHPLGLDAASWIANRLQALAAGRSVIILASFAVSVTVTVSLAIGMHYLVERPGLAMGRRLRPSVK